MVAQTCVPKRVPSGPGPFSQLDATTRCRKRQVRAFDVACSKRQCDNSSVGWRIVVALSREGTLQGNESRVLWMHRKEHMTGRILNDE